MTILRRTGFALSAALVAVTLSSSAHADESNSAALQAGLEKASQDVATLAKSDATSSKGQTAQDVELLRTWVSQGQALLANEEFRSTELLLERLSAKTQFVATKQKRLAADATVQTAKQQLTEVQKSLNEARQATATVEDKLKALEGTEQGTEQ